MPEPLPIVGQYAMDAYYTNYRSQSEFFELSDFIFHCGATLSDIIQKEYKTKYAELRANKSDDVVGFPADWLLEQVVEVKEKDGEMYAELINPVMAFSYDNQVVGVQEVVSMQPKGVRLERATVAEKWQLEYGPTCERIFWYIKGTTVCLVRKSLCSVKKISVLYIPAISESMLVPDGVIKQVIDQTVATIKELEKGLVVKKSLDGNDNKVMQLEANTISGQ